MTVKSEPRTDGKRPPKSSNKQGLTVEWDRSSSVFEVAGELFLTYGYAGVSIEMIVAKTGGSYRDLYRKFGGKESLFHRVMQDVCSSVLAPLRAPLVSETSGSKLEKALLTVGKNALRTLLSPSVIALHRLIVSESPRFPDLGRMFFQIGPASANEAVATILTTCSSSEQLAIKDPLTTASIFLDMLTHNLQLRALTGGTILEWEIEERVQEATRIFLSGIRQTRSAELV